jgi:hypothetical protein
MKDTRTYFITEVEGAFTAYVILPNSAPGTATRMYQARTREACIRRLHLDTATEIAVPERFKAVRLGDRRGPVLRVFADALESF